MAEKDLSNLTSDEIFAENAKLIQEVMDGFGVSDRLRNTIDNIINQAQENVVNEELSKLGGVPITSKPGNTRH